MSICVEFGGGNAEKMSFTRGTDGRLFITQSKQENTVKFLQQDHHIVWSSGHCLLKPSSLIADNETHDRGGIAPDIESKCS